MKLNKAVLIGTLSTLGSFAAVSPAHAEEAKTPAAAISPAEFTKKNKGIYDCTDQRDNTTYRLDSGKLKNNFARNGKFVDWSASTVTFKDLNTGADKTVKVSAFAVIFSCTKTPK